MTEGKDDCQDAVTKLTDVVTRYARCSSQHVLNSLICDQCVDFYLIARDQIDTDFSVCMQSAVVFSTGTDEVVLDAFPVEVSD